MWAHRRSSISGGHSTTSLRSLANSPRTPAAFPVAPAIFTPLDPSVKKPDSASSGKDEDVSEFQFMLPAPVVHDQDQTPGEEEISLANLGREFLVFPFYLAGPEMI